MEACDEDIRVFIVVPLFKSLYVHAKSAVLAKTQYWYEVRKLPTLAPLLVLYEGVDVAVV